MPTMKSVIAIGVAIAVTGCSLQPKYVRPEAPVPATWPASAAADTTSQNIPVLTYAAVFRDPNLRQIVQRGIAESRDLRIALANVELVRAQYRIQRAAQLPVVTGGLGVSIGENANVNSGARTESYTVDVGLNAFELDLFGKLRNQSAAALNEYLASEAGAHAARLSLVSEIANSYLALAADRSRLAIARGVESAAARTVELAEAQFKAELVSRLNVRQAQTLLAQARADIAGLIARIAQDRNALELLVGAPVEDVLLPASLEDVVTLFGEPPVEGLTTYVLLRRPDVARAEYQLKAANARIGAARAALLPKLSLTALIGWTGGAFNTIFNGQDPNWSVQPSARATLFDLSVKGGVALTWAQRDLYVAQYEKAIQTAFREVGDVLARQATIDDELLANQARVEAATDGYSLAMVRYRGGIDALLTTLDAQRQLYAAQQALLQTQLTRASNQVALYRTLGGETVVADSVAVR